MLSCFSCRDLFTYTGVTSFVAPRLLFGGSEMSCCRDRSTFTAWDCFSVHLSEHWEMEFEYLVFLLPNSRASWKLGLLTWSGLLHLDPWKIGRASRQTKLYRVDAVFPIRRQLENPEQSQSSFWWYFARRNHEDRPLYLCKAYSYAQNSTII